MRFVPEPRSAKLYLCRLTLLGKDPIASRLERRHRSTYGMGYPCATGLSAGQAATFTSIVPGWENFVEGDIDCATLLGRRVDRRPRLRHDRHSLQLHSRRRQSEGQQCQRRHVAEGRRHRFRHRHQRRVPCLSAPHHGSSRDGERHARRADRHPYACAAQRISPTNFRMASNGRLYGHRACSSAPIK